MLFLWGGIRWLLCGSFREFKKYPQKSIGTSKQKGKKFAVLAKGLVLFIQKDYLQIKRGANVPNEKQARKINTWLENKNTKVNNPSEEMLRPSNNRRFSK